MKLKYTCIGIYNVEGGREGRRKRGRKEKGREEGRRGRETLGWRCKTLPALPCTVNLLDSDESTLGAIPGIGPDMLYKFVNTVNMNVEINH